MLKKLLVFLTLGFLSLPAYSQSRISYGLYGGMSAKIKTSHSGLLDYWGNGPTMGAFAEISLVGPFSLRGSFSYSRLQYEGPRTFVNYPADAPVDWLASARPSNVYETSISIDASSRLGPVVSFVGLRGGFYTIDMGSITLMSTQPSQLPAGFPTSYVYPGSAVASTLPFVGINLGTGFNVLNGFKIDISVGYDTALDGRAAFVPISLSIGI